mmetsp:Transcript_1140/g.1888  ORF Transcript_1140/g.1888 Transcript_1140/m.1888 type:complete len:437 (+) Transcript_1140:76-1386(+)
MNRSVDFFGSYYIRIHRRFYYNLQRSISTIVFSSVRFGYAQKYKLELRNSYHDEGMQTQESSERNSSTSSVIDVKTDINKNTIITDLITIADYYRFALTQFRSFPLSYGHSTVSAQEDAAFLILQSLKLPVEDGIEHWGACRLVRYERELLVNFIERRVKDRKPSAYILNGCYQQGEFFYVDPRVLIPRSHIGEVLRAYTSYSTAQPVKDRANSSEDELEYDDYFPSYSSDSESAQVLVDDSQLLLPCRRQVHSILDMCTGSGCLAVLAALQFAGVSVDAVDVSQEALAVATMNVQAKQLSHVISLYCGDLYAALPAGRCECYDLIVCNPPYVQSRVLTALPAEYRHEPFQLALDGGEDGLAVIRRVLSGAHRHLRVGGGLLLEVGGPESRPRLAAEYPQLFGEHKGRVRWVKTINSDDEVCYIPKEFLAAEYLQI